MNRHVNAIAGRLSLRPPQRRSLEILDRITEIAPPRKGADVQAALEAIRSEFPSVTDFEREFPSLCFALATGVGKTRLMGAFISYLHLAHGFGNFFVLAPNLTIYNKLTADFTPNTPKYVFTGIAEFATEPPVIITGDTYEQGAGVRIGLLPGYEQEVHVNIFNISKINTEVRGGKSPRIKRLSEYVGQSYFDYLAGLEDLVLIMDESHRYRASAGVRAINELKPILGAGVDRHAVRGDEQGAGALQERHLRLSPRQGHGGWLRQGARRRHPEELQPRRHGAGRDRAAEAGGRGPAARERQGGTGDLRPGERAGDRQAVSCW